MVNIERNLCGIRLENPFLLASGILDENGYTMKKVMEDGAAGVVTKSISKEEKTGYKTPVVVELEDAMINAIGLSNPGIDAFGEEMKLAIKCGKPVIGSIFGSLPDDFRDVAIKMEEFGASAIELNLSCPHVVGVGLEVGSDPVLVRAIIREVKGSVKIPVFAKLSPNLSNPGEIANAALDSDGFTLINTVRAMAIDPHARRPVLSNAYGGLSGPAIKYIGLRMVHEIYRETGRPIMGVGGISSALDAVEYMMAGSAAVQVGTAVGMHGRKIFKELTLQLTEFMKEEGIASLDEIVGIAVKK